MCLFTYCICPRCVYIYIYRFCLQVFEEPWQATSICGRLRSRSPVAWLVVLGFAAGFFARSCYPEPKVECPACSCVCHWTPTWPSEITTGSFPYGWCLLCCILVILLLVSNTALACKITWKDVGTGQDKEIQINVKGKSKGVYSSNRGLSITG